MTVDHKCDSCDKKTTHTHIHKSQCICQICGTIRIIKGTAAKDKPKENEDNG